jgi:transcriptional antiterminator Rof (Rho-off)
MKDSPYHPVACALHETYQLAAMKKLHIDLTWQAEDAAQQKARIRVEDVYTRSQAEYLRVSTQAGESLEIRLDLIESAFWAATGDPLGD